VRVESAGRRPASTRVDHASAETVVRLEGALSGPPTLAAVVEEARARGATAALIVTVPAAGDIVVERVPVAARRVDAAERTTIAGLRPALRRLLAPPPPPRRVLPWAIGGVIVGAAATTAILLLAGDDGDGGIRTSLDLGEATNPR
jgi:hypothetical protein